MAITTLNNGNNTNASPTLVNDDNNTTTNRKEPDFGSTFVPGSENAPNNQAPEPLDHFKRGYKERAELRDRELQDHAEDRNRRPQVSPLSDDVHQKRKRHDEQQSHPRNPSASSSLALVGFDAFDLVRDLSSASASSERIYSILDRICESNPASFEGGKAATAILSQLARRRDMNTALQVWNWMDERAKSNNGNSGEGSGSVVIRKNTYHYNAMITVCEKTKNDNHALSLLNEMTDKGIPKNEVTFSSTISACEKNGNYNMALELLRRMEKEGVPRTVIAYNAAISACEKGLKSGLAMDIFGRMKGEKEVIPTVITYSALISACEKCGQWKLALEVLDEMKAAGFGGNVIAYSACISALSRGQQWEKAIEIFREIEEFGNNPSVVTYNATMTALEKGLQWERALDLFDEMKYKKLPITVVSYGSAISACEKGYQWKQCLDFLDEMTERRIHKNVIIFGAAMSCMEKSCRADIAFQLMERMKLEGVYPNVHIFNSAISACARCNIPEKGYELFLEMEQAKVARDVVTYNAVLDAVCPNVKLARKLFEEGVKKGFYARVSRLGKQWWELDLHFLSLGGGEIALGWWFEECLVPYLVNNSKLAAVKSINIVTGYGKTRMRGARHGDDGMRKRVRGMLRYMKVKEQEQPNRGRVQIDKEAFTKEVSKNGGRIIFDSDGYRKFREQETTANAMPDVPQIRRPRQGQPRKDDHSGRREESDRNSQCHDDNNNRDKLGESRRRERHRRDDGRLLSRQDRDKDDWHSERRSDRKRNPRYDPSEERYLESRKRSRNDITDGRRRGEWSYDDTRYRKTRSRSRGRSRSRTPDRRIRLSGGRSHFHMDRRRMRSSSISPSRHDRFRNSRRDRLSPDRYRDYRRRQNDDARNRGRSRSIDKYDRRFVSQASSACDRYSSSSSQRNRRGHTNSKYEDDRINSRSSTLREKTRNNSEKAASSGQRGFSIEQNRSSRGYDIGESPLCGKRGYDI